MSEQKRVVEPFLWLLFRQLISRRFPLTPADWQALRLAMQSGFGWESDMALCELCCTLWAKSRQEQTIVKTLFLQIVPTEWELSTASEMSESSPNRPSDSQQLDDTMPQQPSHELQPALPPTIGTGELRGLPPISLDGITIPDRPLILVPQYPINYREAAQAWRRLRQPERIGPKVELDIDETISQRTRTGIMSEVALQARRKNRARLLILVDSLGEMSAYKGLVELVCKAISESSKLESVEIFYFSDTPVEDTNIELLYQIDDAILPKLDSVLSIIKPSIDGYLYIEADQITPCRLQIVLEQHAHNASVMVISDAGAAKRNREAERLLDTIAFVKGLRIYTQRIAWLNPLPREKWTNTIAEQIARHVPMFVLNRYEAHAAIDALQGKLFDLERSI